MIALLLLAFAPHFRIVTFGDSLTAPRKGVVTYTDVLAEELPRRGIPIDIYNAGVGGNTSTQARARFDHDVLQRSPDLVIIQLGANDSAIDVWKKPPAAEPRVSIFDYRDNLLYFIRTLREHHAKVILMTPNRLAWTPKLRELYGKPPYHPGDPDGFNLLLDAYSDMMRGIAARERIPLIDVAAAMPASLLLDGMHPNTEGHRLVANLLLKTIPSLLKP
jgi:lysophospholipase L1-like esterase